MDELAALIAALSREDQDLLLGWVRRIATTNTHLAHQFAIRAIPQLQQMAAQAQPAQHMIDAWALHTIDAHDQGGARAAFQVVNEVGSFAQLRHAHAHGAAFEEVSNILLTFVRGLSGRQLKLGQGDTGYTDSEVLYLPAIVAAMQQQMTAASCRRWTSPSTMRPSPPRGNEAAAHFHLSRPW